MRDAMLGQQEGDRKMKIGVFTDLGSWATDRLMIDLRRQFAYSVGVFLMIIAPLVAVVLMPDKEVPHGL